MNTRQVTPFHNILLRLDSFRISSFRNTLFWFCLGLSLVFFLFIKNVEKQADSYQAISQLGQERLERASDSYLLRLATHSINLESNSVDATKPPFLIDCTHYFTNNIEDGRGIRYIQCSDAASELKRRAAIKTGQSTSDITEILPRYDRYYIMNKEVYPEENLSTKETILLNSSQAISRFKESKTAKNVLFYQAKRFLQGLKLWLQIVFWLQVIVTLFGIAYYYTLLDELKRDYHRHRDYDYIRDIFQLNHLDCLREGTIGVFLCGVVPLLSLSVISINNFKSGAVSQLPNLFDLLIPLVLFVIGILFNWQFFRLLSFTIQPDIIMSNAESDRWEETKKQIEEFNERDEEAISEDQYEPEPECSWKKKK